MTDTDPIDRHDLNALKEWIGAEFKVVDTRLEGMAQAIEVQAHDRELKDRELNDVRARFIPREVFEQHLTAFEQRTERVNDALDALERHRAQANVIVAVGIFLSGIIGAAIMKFLIG